ncbi:MAG: transcriptional regulator, partial [Candidatus Korarchaeum sp.]
TLLMEPPQCRKCGYIFKDLKKPRKPSKCPKCGSEWISPPRFTIR